MTLLLPLMMVLQRNFWRFGDLYRNRCGAQSLEIHIRRWVSNDPESEGILSEYNGPSVMVVRMIELGMWPDTVERVEAKSGFHFSKLE